MSNNTADSSLTDTRIEPPHAAPPTRSSRLQIITLIGLAIFCTTFGQPGVVGGFPLRYLLKDHLHLHATQVSAFFAWATLAWYFKPFAGLLSDCFPIFGTRRKYYLLFSALFSVVFWMVMGFLGGSFRLLLVATILLNSAMVIGSTVGGGMLVEAGQAMGATGRLSSLRLFVTNAATLLAAPVGAWMAAHWPFRISAAVAGLSFLPLALLTWRWLHERGAERDLSAWTRTRAELKELGRSKLLWAAIGLWALVKIAPGFGTALFYRMSDVIHFKPGFLALLAVVGSLAGMGAAVLYGTLCRKIHLRTLLYVGILLAALSTLPFVVYNQTSVSHNTALTIDVFNGLLGTLALLPLFDMAARATPAGSAGLGYALLMSVNNIVQQLSDWIGSRLYDAHWPFSSLVWLNAGTTLLVLLAIPFLPALLVERCDG